MDTIEVVDPTHPLYGKTLPLVGVTTRKSLGRAAIVWIRPDVERMVPLRATNLGGVPVPPSPCRLSMDSVERLLAVVASLPNIGSEEEHGENHPSAATGEATGAARAASRGKRAAERRGEGRSPAGGMDDSEAAEQGLGEGEMGRCDEGGGL